MQLRSLREERLRASINAWNPAVAQEKLDGGPQRAGQQRRMRLKLLVCHCVRCAGVEETLIQSHFGQFCESECRLCVPPWWHLVQPAFTSREMREKLQPLMENRWRPFQHQQVSGSDWRPCWRQALAWRTEIRVLLNCCHSYHCHVDVHSWQLYYRKLVNKKKTTNSCCTPVASPLWISFSGPDRMTDGFGLSGWLKRSLSFCTRLQYTPTCSKTNEGLSKRSVFDCLCSSSFAPRWDFGQVWTMCARHGDPH